MAEGFLRSMDVNLDIVSAGTKPELSVNPFAVKVMSEIGIDISAHYPKNVGLFTGENFDYVITVCDNARESCPYFSGEVKHRIHIGFEDPALVRGADEVILAKYREVRDLITDQFREFYQNAMVRSEKPPRNRLRHY